VAASGIPYLFDLGNELFPYPYKPTPIWDQYIRTLWERYVSVYGNADTVGFSAIGGGRLNKMPLYGTIKPKVIDIHYYHEDEQETERVQIKIDHDSLVSQNLSGIDVIVGEAYYNDSISATELRAAINEFNSEIWFRYLLQWPFDRNWKNSPCGNQITQPPPKDYQNYLQKGF